MKAVGYIYINVVWKVDYLVQYVLYIWDWVVPILNVLVDLHIVTTYPNA